MGNDPFRKSRDLTPRERREKLQRFSPADAAFVLHLADCERCREQAARILGPGDLPLAELQKFLSLLSSEQAGFIGHLLGCERCRQAVAKALKPRKVLSVP